MCILRAHFEKQALMIQKLKFPLISGVILYLAWPTLPFSFLLFFAFLPLFILEEKIERKKYGGFHFFLYILIAKLIWNTGTTWWICNITLGGGIGAIIPNSLLMCLPWIVYRRIKPVVGIKVALLTFMGAWLTFENIHLNWALSWPWLTLGNAFAYYHQWVQWYEYTGALGGSLWVLSVNIYLFLIIQRGSMGRKKLIWLVSLLLLPLLISYTLYYGIDENESEDKVEVVALQPNVDPVKEKFNTGDHFISPLQQVKNLISQSHGVIDQETDFLLWPETAVQGKQFERKLEQSNEIMLLQTFLKKYPKLVLITGLDSWNTCENQDEPSRTANYNSSVGYYEYYNTALIMKHGKSPVVYHKSKLVPGAESMPFPSLVSALDLLGIGASSMTPQDEPLVYDNGKDKVAPVICYESIFGEFISGFVEHGADYLFIITNDGWWGDTEGHRHHLLYAKLRAIESRISIVRSANTGISAYINTRGDIVQKTKWWEKNAVKASVPRVQKHHVSFYNRYGDYIGRLSYFLLIFTVLSAVVKWRTKKMP